MRNVVIKLIKSLMEGIHEHMGKEHIVDSLGISIGTIDIKSELIRMKKL